MNTEEIKALARAYAETQVDRADCNSDEEYNLVMSRWVKDVSDAYEFLAKRYCIVEKFEVMAQHHEHMARMREVSSAKQINRAKAIALENLFGKEIFKEE